MVTPLYELTYDYVRMPGKVVLHIINKYVTPSKKGSSVKYVDC